MKATPEECVRQHVLNHLIDDLHYPPSLISVEKELKFFYLGAPRRRLDILVFTPADGGFKPFLLVECKSVPLTKRVENQVFSYNTFVKAPFVAIVNQNEVRTASLVNSEWTFVSQFPNLIEKLN